MKAFLNEFKAFIAKGNVLSMAIGIIVGSAFTAIVTSLNQDIITPLLGLIIGKIDFAALSFTVGSATVAYGKFIQAVITFLITALVLFLLLKVINRFIRKQEEEEKEKKEAAPVPQDIQLLTEIRDLLANEKQDL